MANIKNKLTVTYQVPAINNFLESIGYPYAASCFRAQYGPQETITDLEIEKFLRYYFADTNKAQFVYRKMETVVTGYVNII
jgi:hypothetical protein